MSNQIFKSSIRKSSDWGVTFEDDGETGYFYLCKIIDGEPNIQDHIHIYTSNPGLREADISIMWSPDWNKAALFIKGEPWAMYDIENQTKEGGMFVVDGKSTVTL